MLNVIDCTDMGASPPIFTPLILICFVGYLCKFYLQIFSQL
ncbi:hypothetical protein CAMRE0001_1045 [Campylobacter rectus RM3267]|uniref:Uncharacterized protein n=1 Tax=Campylobacter rectus RM3267 TaxID=553218 RepID=B9D2U6_CAMRE|nr:hypothetical protein CAMRE0001_1045 [Campylobacter rectus RM3267]